MSTLRAGRLKELHRRVRRLPTLGKFGVVGLRFLRTGLGPVGLFGVAVSGMLRGHLVQIRRTFHVAAVKRPVGRSATVDFELLKPTADPASG